MSLKEIAQQTLSSFNPATDNPNAAQDIPAGEYDIYVDKIGHRIYEKSGYDCVNVMAKIIGGDYADRVENININIDPDYDFNRQYPFLLQKNIKLISQLSYAIGVELTDEDWECQESVGLKFAREGVGKQCILKIMESPNKKDPSRPYRNYEFIAYEEGGVESLNSVDINEEDLPF